MSLASYRTSLPRDIFLGVEDIEEAIRSMKILVLGGTQFVGRHLVELLLQGGHDVTLLNRGKTGPELFPSARRLVGDRSDEATLSRLKKESGFDALIDFCALFPRDVEKLLPLLPLLTEHYIQISSVSAYSAMGGGDSVPFIRDEDPLWDCTDAQALDKTDSTFGNRKSLCDRLAMQRCGVPVTVFLGLTRFRGHFRSVLYGLHDARQQEETTDS
jgi:2'-hydroxyisoflavone reductase